MSEPFTPNVRGASRELGFVRRFTSVLRSLEKGSIIFLYPHHLLNKSGWLVLLASLIFTANSQAQTHDLRLENTKPQAMLAINRVIRIQNNHLPVNQRTEDCPTITNTNITALSVCSGQLVDGLQVNTSATNPPYVIEFVRFDSAQANPYLGKNGVHLGEIHPFDGKATATDVPFPENTTVVDKVYYVYACLKPEPDISVCSPFALITVTINPRLTTCLPLVIRKTKRAFSAQR
ncbi:hypothetical protein ACFSUS_04745 [Spirosoma soli]|uniref:Uncharacterized protein n=1 Tax=Spirosoma soli TaxID=1770529 RepID=A0ABW5LYT1_9BACT